MLAPAVCIYINIYTYVYIYIYTYMYTRLYVCVYVYVYKHRHMYVYTNIYIYIYIRMGCNTERVVLSLMVVMTKLVLHRSMLASPERIAPQLCLGSWPPLTSYRHSECNTLLIQPCVDRYAHMQVPTGTINTYTVSCDTLTKWNISPPDKPTKPTYKSMSQ